MKILHIASTLRNGAGRSAVRLHEGLKGLGAQSRVLTLERCQSTPDAVIYSEEKELFTRAVERIKYELWQREYRSYASLAPRGSGAFSDDRTLYDVAEHPLVKEADIVHLHWVARFIDPAKFFPHIADKQVVWTFHDMNPFTGGCHYSQRCSRFDSACGKCPQLGTYDSTDLSHRIWKRKASAYRQSRFTIVSPSMWLAGLAAQSSLMKGRSIEVIPYGLPIDVFTCRDKKASRDLVGVPQDTYVILLWVDARSIRRGGRLLAETLVYLEKTIGTKAATLLMIGGNTKDIIGSTQFSFKDMGQLSDDLLLSSCFNAADILIVPSWEDNFPNIVLESLACGTPVAAFKSGGISEIVDDGATGVLVESKDAKALAAAVARILKDSALRQSMSAEARKKVEGAYRLETQASRYLELYWTLKK